MKACLKIPPETPWESSIFNLQTHPNVPEGLFADSGRDPMGIYNLRSSNGRCHFSNPKKSDEPVNLSSKKRVPPKKKVEPVNLTPKSLSHPKKSVGPVNLTQTHPKKKVEPVNLAPKKASRPPRNVCVCVCVRVCACARVPLPLSIDVFECKNISKHKHPADVLEISKLFSI